MILLYDQVFPS